MSDTPLQIVLYNCGHTQPSHPPPGSSLQWSFVKSPCGVCFILTDESDENLGEVPRNEKTALMIGRVIVWGLLLVAAVGWWAGVGG